MSAAPELPIQHRLRWINSVLVPLDGTAQATAAIPVAKTLAELAGVSLHIVHADNNPRPPRSKLRELGVKSSLFEGAVLDQLSGEPGEAVRRLALSRPGSLIVMCGYTEVDRPRKILGRVAKEIVSHATGPVILVHPERGSADWQIRRMLFPHDGSPTSNTAFPAAAELAEAAGAELLVLHVSSSGSVAHNPPEPGTMTTPRYVDQPQHEWPTWAREFLERIRALSPSRFLKLRLFLLVGNPAVEILDFTREHHVDLLVAVWHGSWEDERAKTIKTLVRESGSPVLLLPAKLTPKPIYS